MNLETLIANRLAELTSGNFAADHDGNGRLSDDQKEGLQMDDPTDLWEGPDMEDFDAAHMRNFLSWFSDSSLPPEGEHEENDLSGMIDEAIQSRATELFIAWCAKQEWYGRCPMHTLRDVYVYLV